jgi:hypothetical protein
VLWAMRLAPAIRVESFLTGLALNLLDRHDLNSMLACPSRIEMGDNLTKAALFPPAFGALVTGSQQGLGMPTSEAMQSLVLEMASRRAPGLSRDFSPGRPSTTLKSISPSS